MLRHFILLVLMTSVLIFCTEEAVACHADTFTPSLDSQTCSCSQQTQDSFLSPSLSCSQDHQLPLMLASERQLEGISSAEHPLKNSAVVASVFPEFFVFIPAGIPCDIFHPPSRYFS